MKTIVDKSKYCEWAVHQSQLPLFMQPWWMDAVCAGKEWDAMLWVDEANNQDGDIVAVMPFLLCKRLGTRYVLMPQQTQIGGVYLPPDKDTDMVTLSTAVSEAIDSLHLVYYHQQFSIGNPLPACMQEHGFKIRPMVTYRLEDLSNLNAVIDRFSKNKKRLLQKALALHTSYDMTAEQFYHFHSSCMHAQHKKLTYSREFFLVLAQKTRKLGQSQLITIADADGHTCAAAFVIWDDQALYYLLSCYHPDYKDTGAEELLVLEAIKLAREKGVLFDFMGSSIRGVAQHYQQFGSTSSSFYRVERYYKWWFRLPILWNRLRNWKK